MLARSIADRLAGQLDGLSTILRDSSPDLLTARAADGKWSAHENLAHLLRHHEVMMERIERILREDRPALPRYRAEDDSAWPAVAALPPDEVVRLLRGSRERLAAFAGGLSDAQLQRTGIHPVFGELNVPEWLEFFLLHEAHHLYVAFARLGAARAAIRSAGLRIPFS